MRHVVPHVGSGSAVSGATLQTMPHLRRLLYIGPPDVISAAMTAAIQKEFPFLVVSQSIDMTSALEEFDIPLRLLLIDMLHLDELNEYAAQLLAQHPSVIFAIVTDGDLRESVEQLHNVDTNNINGVLPLNVSLDVLLSMLRIILRGGTYFPSITYRSREDIGRPHESGNPREDTKSALAHEAQGKIMGQLTKRENEILGKIALGNQNKIIAATLGLSEHTVKIHIHNIIRKLGVHNRTEAVALYFEYRDKLVAGSNDGHRTGSTTRHRGDA